MKETEHKKSKKENKMAKVALRRKAITCARTVNKNETCLATCICMHVCLILMGLFVKWNSLSKATVKSTQSKSLTTYICNDKS